MASFIQEAVYTNLLFSCFIILGLESNTYFCLTSSFFFGLSHCHMRWEAIKAIIKTPLAVRSVGGKLKDLVEVCWGLVLVSALFSLYSKGVFLKYQSFYPPWIIHMVCNWLGTPRVPAENSSFFISLHVVGILGCLAIITLS